jgi:hypothetical protein
MAIIIRWQVPASTSSETEFDLVKIERASSENGNYTEIASQAITDNTYSDEDGTTESWYRVRFYNSDTENYSAYSESMQGGTFVGYCSMADFRAVTNLTTSCISDSDVYDLITMAAYQINGDLNTKVIRERIDYIDSTRQNLVDGSNTTYYVKNWKGKYLADFNNDSLVNTEDVTIYAIDSDGTETTPTIDSIDVDEGKIVLSEAQSNKTLYVTYAWSYIDESVPARPLRLACAFLTAALAQARINIGRAPQIQMGNLRLYRHMDAYDEYYQKYLGILRQINDQMIETIDVEGILG